MPKNNKARNKIIWATILFALVSVPPMLTIFNIPAMVGNIPAFFVYIFFTWLVFILYTAFQSRKINN